MKYLKLTNLYSSFIIACSLVLILQSCTNKPDKTKLSTRTDTLNYISLIVKDSIGFGFKPNNVLEYNIHFEKSDFGKYTDSIYKSVSSKSIEDSKKLLAIQRQYGSDNILYINQEAIIESNRQLITRCERELAEPISYTGKVNQIFIRTLNEDNKNYIMTVDKELNILNLQQVN